MTNKAGVIVFILVFTLFAQNQESADLLKEELTDLPEVKVISPENQQAEVSLKWSEESGELKVSVPDEGRHVVEIVNMQGSRLSLKEGFGAKVHKFKQGLAPGKCIVRVVTESRIFIKKFMVKI
jgi:hypothetical protein